MYYNIKTQKTGTPQQILPQVQRANTLSDEQLDRLYNVIRVQEIIPEPYIQKADGVDFNEATRTAKTKIVDLPIPELAELIERKKQEFQYEFIEISNMVNYCRNNQEVINTDLEAVISYARRLKNLTIQKIESFTDTLDGRIELMKFRVLPEDKKAIIEKFKPFM